VNAQKRAAGPGQRERLSDPEQAQMRRIAPCDKERILLLIGRIDLLDPV